MHVITTRSCMYYVLNVYAEYSIICYPRVGHGLDPSMDRVGLNWVGLSGMTATSLFN